MGSGVINTDELTTGDFMDLSKYMLEKAKRMLTAAKDNLEKLNDVETAANRSYYAIFCGIRAVNILDGFDASKHAGAMSHFNRFHVKTGHFDKETSKKFKTVLIFGKNRTIEPFGSSAKRKSKIKSILSKEF